MNDICDIFNRCIMAIKRTGKEVTTFWLEGDLKISAITNRFLKKSVYAGELPYMPSHIALLKQLMIVEKNSTIYHQSQNWLDDAHHPTNWVVCWVS